MAPSTESDDAMDKIVGKLDCSIGKAMSRPDAMDLILINKPNTRLDVETHQPTKDDSGKEVEKVSFALDVETLRLNTTPCTVRIRRLESILFDDEPTHPDPPSWAQVSISHAQNSNLNHPGLPEDREWQVLL